MVNSNARTRFYAFKQKLGTSEEARRCSNSQERKGVTANEISNTLFKTSNIKPNKQEKSQARTSYARELKHCELTTPLMYDFTDSETEMALKVIKSDNASGTDGVLPEFLKFLGTKGRKLANQIGHSCSKN